MSILEENTKATKGIITGEEPITKIYNEYNGKNYIEDVMDALLSM